MLSCKTIINGYKCVWAGVCVGQQLTFLTIFHRSILLLICGYYITLCQQFEIHITLILTTILKIILRCFKGKIKFPENKKIQAVIYHCWDFITYKCWLIGGVSPKSVSMFFSFVQGCDDGFLTTISQFGLIWLHFQAQISHFPASWVWRRCLTLPTTLNILFQSAGKTIKENEDINLGDSSGIIRRGEISWFFFTYFPMFCRHNEWVQRKLFMALSIGCCRARSSSFCYYKKKIPWWKLSSSIQKDANSVKEKLKYVHKHVHLL